jgi:uncharacterized protein YdhG (YjbR/CyaY superfamily)
MAMKKAAKRAAGKKRAAGPKSVDEYLARVHEPARSALRKMRTAILAAAPKGTDEVISYGIPAFRWQQVLVWIAAFRGHCSFFPTAAVIAEFKDELAGYKLAKGTIQFPVDRPLPAALVKKMVKARVAAVEGKKRG